VCYAQRRNGPQAELAAQVGVARGTINAIETGKYAQVCRWPSDCPRLGKTLKKYFFTRRANQQHRRI